MSVEYFDKIKKKKIRNELTKLPKTLSILIINYRCRNLLKLKY